MTATLPVRGRPAKLRDRSVEFRAAADTTNGDGRTLEGYAAVFNVATEIDSWEGSFQEVIMPGAFKRSINARTPVLQFDHGRDARTGTVPIGAFTDLHEDDQGLFVQARLFDNPVVEPVRQAIAGGAITGMSFRFRVVNDTWTDAKGKKVDGQELLDLLWSAGERGPITRSIKEVELFEAGPVVFPAYDETSVGVRSMLDSLTDEQRAELLRELTQRQEPDEPDPPVTSSPPGEQQEPEAPPSAGLFDAQNQGDPEPADEGTSTESESGRNVDMADIVSVEERTTRLKEIDSRLREIDIEATGSELSDFRQEEWDKLINERATHERAIKAVEERRKLLGETVREEHREPGFDRGPAIIVNRGDDIYDRTAVRQKANSHEEMVAAYRDNAKRCVERGSFWGNADKERAQANVVRLLETSDDVQGNLAQRVMATSSPLYMRAFGKALQRMSTDGLSTEERNVLEEARALAIGSDGTHGNYAVPALLDPTVINTSNGVINPLRQLARVETITGYKDWEGVTSAGITVSRTGETTEASDNAPTFGGPTVKALPVHGFVPFSMDIGQDWGGLLSSITSMLADAKDTEEASSFVTGSGTGSPVQPNGLVTTLDSGSHVISHNDVDGAASFAVSDLYALKNALPPRFRARAQFLGETSIFDLVRQFDTDGGANLWEYLGNGLPARLLGYSVNEISTMSAAPIDNEDAILVFGDFSEFLIVDAAGMNVELVPHLFGSSNRYPTGQRGIYARWRNNCKILADNAFRLLVVNSAASS